jgi:hypothetical protein
VIKAGKNNRLCWDRSTTIKPTDIVMNQASPVIREAPITFGHVKMQLYTDIYNTCLSYPTLTILLAMADVKACYRFPCIHADLTGAFGFLAGGYFNLASLITKVKGYLKATQLQPSCFHPPGISHLLVSV